MIKTNEESEGQTSWMRVYLSFYFWLIALPGSFVIFFAMYKMVASGDSSNVLLLLGMFFGIHLFWSAPKVFQKIAENIGKR
jgi:hypothetical protein